ncbi:PREDICTED: prosaposin [Dipodomys ordii]|uniref:Prosaposin n=1 Tax=Dipodomys ordii TaxID=10020 RepID=A0A1S3FXC7_DIPOR|nr:PREDICTED: prosaposin [Dipodomys ordii]
MYALVLLAGLLGTALASPIPDLTTCSGGSAVLCQNLKTAVDCGAVKHCQQMVWSKPTVNSLPCNICIQVITAADNMLKENNTEEEILGYLEKMCDWLPNPNFSSKCKETVESYLPVILDLIKQEIVRGDGANRLFFSVPPAQSRIIEMKSVFMVDNSCQVFNRCFEHDRKCFCCMSKLDADSLQIMAADPENWKQSLDCSFRSLGGSRCRLCLMVLCSFQQPKEICVLVGFCDEVKAVPMQTLIPAKVAAESVLPALELVETVEEELIQAQAGVFCKACEFVVKQMDKLIENNITEEEVFKSLNVTCSLLPATVSSVCHEMVDVYGPSVWSILEHEISPELVCQELNLCSSDKERMGKIGRLGLPQPPKLPKLSASPARVTQLKKGGFCEVCKKLISYLEHNLEKNSTKEEILAALEKGCSFLPDPYKNQCDEFVTEYEPVLVEILVEVMDPSFVCTKIGACSSARKLLLGTEKCVWGPGYWCQNMETAAQCNAVDHCKRHVWN